MAPAMAVAVFAWSPVIIFTAMPAAWQAATASAAAGRGGSSIACSPQKTSARRATTRRARRPRARTARPWPAPAARRRPGRRPPAARRPGPAERAVPSAAICAWHSGSTRSTAPLTSTTRRRPAGSSCSVAMYCRSELNGTVSTRGRPASTSASRPALPATTSSAASVGSPTMVGRPSFVAEGRRRCSRPRPAGTSAAPWSAATSAGRPAASQDLPVGSVAGAGHLEGPRRRPQPPDRHLVLGERAGLVGADDGGAAEGLHGRQPADDRPAAGHPRDPDRQGDGDRRRQALGDGADGQRDRCGEHLHGPLAADHADGEGDRGQREDHHGEDAAEPGDLAGQRGGQRRGGADQPVDLPELGVGAGGRHHPGPGPAR